MNYFFCIKSLDFNCKLTIPKFQNNGYLNKNNLLFQAKIKNNKWEIQKTKYNENKEFFFPEEDNCDNETIFFIAKDNEIEKYYGTGFSKLLKLNNFTETQPAFRSNLRICNKAGGFSSYQSEYPFRMIEKKFTILSPLSSLLDPKADYNRIFIKNIYQFPIKDKINVYFINYNLRKIIKKVTAHTNFSNEINIEKELITSDIFLYMKPFGGIPLFVSVKNNHISFEHTHPPHEYIISHDKFIKVQELKDKFEAIIN
jgi:hypothetical protein